MRRAVFLDRDGVVNRAPVTPASVLWGGHRRYPWTNLSPASWTTGAAGPENLYMMWRSAFKGDGSLTRLLQLMGVSTLPLAVNFLFFSVRRVKRRVGAGWRAVSGLTLELGSRGAAATWRVGLPEQTFLQWSGFYLSLSFR